MVEEAKKEQIIMTIMSVHHIYGKGTILVGYLECEVKSNDDAIIQTQSGAYSAKIWGIEMYAKKFDKGHTGEGVGLMFRNVKYMDMCVGDKVYKV